MQKTSDNVSTRAAIFFVAVVAVILSFCAMVPGTAAQAFADELQTGEIAETGIEKAMRLIGALPADPEEIDESWRASVEAATDAYDALSESERDTLDATTYQKSQTYGRWIESAQWGLAAHTAIDSTSTLLDGDYTKYASSTSSMGKSTSVRSKEWNAVAVKASGDATQVVIACDSQSAFRSMRVGGVMYDAELVDGVPQFTVAMPVNTTVCFLVDTTDQADSIAYTIEVSLPMTAASKAEVATAKSTAASMTKKKLTQYESASATALSEAAANLKQAANKSGVTAMELEIASAAYDAALASAVKKSGSSDSSSQSSGQSKGSGSQSASSHAMPHGGGIHAIVPRVAGRSNPSSSAGAGQSKGDGKSGEKADKPADSKAKKPADDTARNDSGEVAVAESASQPVAVSVQGEATTDAETSPWTEVALVGCITGLVLLGMCVRTILFARAKVVG